MQFSTEFEGTRIAHLHKQSEFKYVPESEKQNCAQQEDYVLAKLFKKTGEILYISNRGSFR